MKTVFQRGEYDVTLAVMDIGAVGMWPVPNKDPGFLAPEVNKEHYFRIHGMTGGISRLVYLCEK